MAHIYKGGNKANRRAILVAAFERFTRVDRTCDGAGLGLAIVAAIAAAHGGRAEIDTPPTTARMRLPSATMS